LQRYEVQQKLALFNEEKVEKENSWKEKESKLKFLLNEKKNIMVVIFYFVSVYLYILKA
jgi:hypothetical protein